MQIFYFHLRDGEDLTLDPDGRWLPDSSSVIGVALYEARAIISDDARSGRLRLDQRIDVEDETGAIIHRLLFQNAIEITPPAIEVKIP